MSISGDLQDVSVAEVMQFIHLGRRTGTLSVRHGERRAEVGFHRGRIISAWTPGAKRLGELLAAAGLVERARLDELLERQQREKPRRSLGKMVLSEGLVDAAELRRVIGRQIEESVYDLVTWRRGTFDFALDELRPIDDIGVYPGDILPDINLDTQMVVLDGLRIFDERNRRAGREPGADGAVAATREALAGDADGEAEVEAPPAEAIEEPEAEPGGEPSAVEAGEAWRDRAGDEPLGDESFPGLLEAPAEAAAGEQVEEPPVRFQVVSDDDGLLERLRESVPGELARVARVDLLDAGLTLPGETSPVVLVDLRNDLTLDDLAQLARTRPRATLLSVVDPWVAPVRTYESGALAALPPDPIAISACLASVVRTRHTPLPSGADPLQVSSGFAKLRRVVADLRSGLLSATVALNLMQVISESVERAVMFLVRDDSLRALGAFGFNASSESLATITSGLQVPLSEAGALADAVDQGQTRSMLFEEARLPESFARLIDRPRTGQVVVFPVLGSTRVISVVYADNGALSREIEEIEILELAAAQVGVAFENEMLRRRMRRGSS